MKKIYLVLMHTYTIPSKLVKFFTRYEYSHVGISLEKECNKIYSFGRKNVKSILDGGFTVNKKDGEFFNKFNNTVCKIYEMNVNEEQYKKVSEIINDIEKNEEKYKYDFKGIIPRFFGIPLTTKNQYVCSYFVADVLQKAKIYSFDKKVCFIKPKDFEKINKCCEIYKGYYNLYE